MNKAGENVARKEACREVAEQAEYQKHGEQTKEAEAQQSCGEEELTWISDEVETIEARYRYIKSVPGSVSFEENMLLHNTIPGLLCMETLWESGEKQRRYIITGYRNLEEHQGNKPFEGAFLIRLMKEIVAVIRSGKRHLLAEEGYVIRPECIYIQEKMGEIGICYYPEYACPLDRQLAGFSEWLLDRINPEDVQAVYLGYALYVVCHKEHLSLTKLQEILQEAEKRSEIEREEQPANGQGRQEEPPANGQGRQEEPPANGQGRQEEQMTGAAETMSVCEASAGKSYGREKKSLRENVGLMLKIGVESALVTGFLLVLFLVFTQM